MCIHLITASCLILPHLASAIIVQIWGINHSGSVVALCHSLRPTGHFPWLSLLVSAALLIGRPAALHISVWLLHQLQSLVHASRRQLPIDVPVAAPQEVTVGGPQITVEKRINKRINEGVGVSEPQQSSLQPEGHAAALHAADKRPGGGHLEERQPAEGEGADHDAQSGRGLLLPLEDGLVFPLPALVVFTGLEEARDARAALLLHLALELQRRCHAVQALLLFLFSLCRFKTSCLS